MSNRINSDNLKKEDLRGLNIEQLKQLKFKSEVRISACKDSVKSLNRMLALYEELYNLVFEPDFDAMDNLDVLQAKAEELGELAIAEHFDGYIALSDRILAGIQIFRTIQEKNR